MTGSQFLEGGCWKRGGDFFEQGEGGRDHNCCIKNKLKFEVLNKKNTNQNAYWP